MKESWSFAESCEVQEMGEMIKKLLSTPSSMVLARPLVDVLLIAAPFGCGQFKQEHHLDHFLNPTHSTY